jgi:hypothetical protein
MKHKNVGAGRELGKLGKLGKLGEMGKMREMREMRTVMVETYHGVSVCRGGFRD